MGLRNFLKGSSLPDPEKITEYRHLAPVVEAINAEHREQLQNALTKHPELSTAWTIINDSAHPDCIIPSVPELDDGRRLMVRDLISAVQTGELTAV
jgi:hypothetical protein